ncbi:MAG: hypothetical protein ABS36_05445 [Acidobacteria bacterium SCN 69-37]|nr:MAG: hypothetical protein ABS36_05445 [Acidobacteria bacterium SCN 69-37]
MHLSDRLTGLLAALLGLAVILYARTFPPMLGQDIGPALFPSLVGAGLLIFGAVLAATDANLGARWVEFAPWTRRPRMVVNGLLVMAMLGFYVVAVEPVGFLVTSIVFLGVLMRALGAPLRVTVPVAVVVSLVIHYVFYSLLRVPLPWGVLQGIAW